MFRLKGRKPSEKRIRAAFEELRDLVRAKCLALGGVPIPEDVGGRFDSVAVLVPTRHGALWVWGPHLSEFLTVFARFEDEDRGKKVFGANPYTGKWNYHGGTIREGATPSTTFEAWQRELDALRGGTRADIDAAIEASRERSRQMRQWFSETRTEQQDARDDR